MCCILYFEEGTGPGVSLRLTARGVAEQSTGTHSFFCLCCRFTDIWDKSWEVDSAGLGGMQSKGYVGW